MKVYVKELDETAKDAVEFEGDSPEEACHHLLYAEDGWEWMEENVAFTITLVDDNGNETDHRMYYANEPEFYERG